MGKLRNTEKEQENIGWATVSRVPEKEIRDKAWASMFLTLHEYLAYVLRDEYRNNPLVKWHFNHERLEYFPKIKILKRESDLKYEIQMEVINPSEFEILYGGNL